MCHASYVIRTSISTGNTGLHMHIYNRHASQFAGRHARFMLKSGHVHYGRLCNPQVFCYCYQQRSLSKIAKTDMMFLEGLGALPTMVILLSVDVNRPTTLITFDRSWTTTTRWCVLLSAKPWLTKFVD